MKRDMKKAAISFAVLSAVLAGCASILGIDDVSPVALVGPDSSITPDAGPADVVTGDDQSTPGPLPEAGLTGACIDAGLTCASNASCVPNGNAPTCVCNFGWKGDPSACVNSGPTCAGD